MLPGSKALLFTAGTPGSLEDANIVVQPLPAGTPKVIQRSAYYARHLPSGHLVYVHEGTLFGAVFDTERLEITSQAVPVLEGVTANSSAGGAQFAISADGTLVYVPGQAFSNAAPIYWMDREGKTTLLRVTAANWSNPAFSSDGSQLAMDISDGKQTDIWVYDWQRDAPTALPLTHRTTRSRSGLQMDGALSLDPNVLAE